MLARRFTIVCLVIAIFGMGLSVLVADKTMRSATQSGFFLACDAATSPHGCVQFRR